MQNGEVKFTLKGKLEEWIEEGRKEKWFNEGWLNGNLYSQKEGGSTYNHGKLAFHKPKLVNIQAVYNENVDPIEAPINIWVKPTNKCDHGCNFCSYGHRTACPVTETMGMKDELTREKFMEFIDDCHYLGVKSFTFTGGGESTIHPNIVEALEKTYEYGIGVSMITHGGHLSGRKAELMHNADWLRVSLSETDPTSFRKVRHKSKGTFDTVVRNIENFSKNKKPSCYFGINYIIHEEITNKLYNDVKFFKDLGVDYVKFTPAYGAFPEKYMNEKLNLGTKDNPIDLQKRTRENSKLKEAKKEAGLNEYTDRDYWNYHGPYLRDYLEQISDAREDFQSDKFKVFDTILNDFMKSSNIERPTTKCPIMQTVPTLGADGGLYFCHDKTYAENGKYGNIYDMRFRDLWEHPETRRKMRELNPQCNCRHHCTYDDRNISALQMIGDLDNLDRYQPASQEHKNYP